MIGCLAGCLSGLAASPATAADPAPPRVEAARLAAPWVVYYSDQAPLDAFDPYGVVVLDSEYHPPLRPLADRGKTLLGYVSLGEVERHRPWFAAVEAEGLLGAENPNWPGSFYVDVRDPRWTQRVLTDIVPGILRRGFHGVFLDTLDNPVYLEEADPARWAGMTEAAATLVRALRLHYPRMPIMLNRAYALLPEVGGSIDMVLGESVHADYDFDAETYGWVEDDLYREQVRLLKEAKTRHPGLAVMTLDYWRPDDAATIARIYAEQRRNGFNPYVATVELDRIVPEPPP